MNTRQAGVAAEFLRKRRVLRCEFGEGALISVPDVRGGGLDCSVGTGEALDVSGQGIVTLLDREVIAERFEKLGAEYLRSFDEGPFGLFICSEKEGAQDEAGYAVGVFFGIGERERRPPRAANDRPFLYAEMFADHFQVGDQMGGRVGAAGEVGVAAAGAALVD